MISFFIIEELEERRRIYSIDKYRGNSLWLADDATLITGMKEDMEENIKVLTEAAGRYGLILNEKKTKVLHVR